MGIVPWWQTATVNGGWAVAAIGLLILLWAVRGDRSRSRRRCRRCWYDMAGLSPMQRDGVMLWVCPECGGVHHRERAMLKTRRHRGRIALQLLVVLPGAYGMCVWPRVRDHGWPGAVPNVVLVVLGSVTIEAPDPNSRPVRGARLTRGLVGGGSLRLTRAARTLTSELHRRCRARELWQADRLLLYFYPTARVALSGRTAPRTDDHHDDWLVWGFSRDLPDVYLRWLWRSVDDGLVHMRPVWVRGEPLRVWIAPPKWFEDLNLTYEGSGDWPGSEDQTNARRSWRIWPGIVTLPAISQPGNVRVVVRKPRSSVTPDVPGEVVHERLLKSPRLVETCEQAGIPDDDAVVTRSLIGSIAISRLSRDDSLNVVVNVQSWREHLSSDRTIGMHIEVTHDAAIVGRWSLHADILQPDTVETALAIGGRGFDDDAWSRGTWAVRITSDPCAILASPTASRWWRGRAVGQFEPARPDGRRAVLEETIVEDAP